MNRLLDSIIFFVLLCISLALFFENQRLSCRTKEGRADTLLVHDTFVKHDTIRLIRQVPVKREKVDVKVIPSDSKPFISLPIYQNTYSDDNSYKAWITGAYVTMDSIHVYQKTEYKETFRTIYKERTKWNTYVFVGGNSILGDFAPSVGISMTSPKKWCISLEGGCLNKDVWGGIKIGYKIK